MAYLHIPFTTTIHVFRGPTFEILYASSVRAYVQKIDALADAQVLTENFNYIL